MLKILQLCKKFPYPQKDGETIAIHNLTKGYYALGHQVTVLAINTPKHYFDPAQLPHSMAQQAQYHAVYINTNIKLLAALRNLFTNKSYNIERFNHPQYHKKLQRILLQYSFDVIELEGLYLTPYLPTIRKYGKKALVVMRSHNVEFEIWERLAQTEKRWLKKRYLNLLATRLRRFETKQLNTCDAMVPISEKDEQYFKSLGCKVPTLTIPTGIDTDKLQQDDSDLEYPSIFHLGSLDWLPNQEGLFWFFDEVWPAIHKKYPKVTLYIAGRNAPSHILNLQIPGVKIVGEVEDAVEFMNSKAIMIVPLHAGSGMRIKIIEALALGKTILSTSIGAEGIHAQHNKEILITNTANEFIEGIDKCLKDRSFFDEIGKNAAIFVHKEYDNLALTQRLIDFYNQLLDKKL